MSCFKGCVKVYHMKALKNQGKGPQRTISTYKDLGVRNVVFSITG